MDSEQYEAFKKARRKSLGASDMAAVCGVSHFGTPLHVYLEKRGEWERPDNPAMKWGRLLEDTVARIYGEVKGCSVVKPEQVIAYSADDPWLHASLDFRVVWRNGEVDPLEVKTGTLEPGQWGAGEDHDEPEAVPLAYYLQVQQQMFVVGAQRVRMAALLGGRDFRTYTIQRNEDLIARIRRIGKDFWAMIQEGSPPRLDYDHPDAVKLAQTLHKLDEEEVIDRPSEHVFNLASDFVGARLAEKLATKEKKALQAALIDMMKGASTMRCRGGVVVTRRVDRRGVERFSVRMPNGGESADATEETE